MEAKRYVLRFNHYTWKEYADYTGIGNMHRLSLNFILNSLYCMIGISE